MILAGDIGATKTILGLFSPEPGPTVPLTEATFPSADYRTLEDMALDFLSEVKHDTLKAACFGVAGPVKAGCANVTNLEWVLEEEHLSSSLRIRNVKLINDLQAVAAALPLLTSSDIETLNPGVPEKNGIRAIIAPGTGLGEAFLTRDGSRWRSHATEGGHADFAPSGKEQVGLLHYMENFVDHVSYELVCSGIGIPHIFGYLKDSEKYEIPAWLREAIRTTDDLTPVIIDGAMKKGFSCQLCMDTLRMFVSILGAEAGNLALKILPTGGLYIGGGIPLRILPLIRNGNFMETFTAKGRMSRIMEDIPVHVILNTRAALMGAAKESLEILTEGPEN
jgi:glucokinase